MLRLLYIPMTKEWLGYFTPDVCHCYQRPAALRIAVLKILHMNLQAVLGNFYRSTSVQALVTLMQRLTSVMIAPLAYASRIN